MASSDQVQALRLMMQTDGWKTVFQPWLVATGHDLVKQILEVPSRRTAQWRDVPEDVMRGEIRRIEYILTWTANQLQVEDHNRLRDELDQAKNGAEVPVT
jgi:hypothetical protein